MVLKVDSGYKNNITVNIINKQSLMYLYDKKLQFSLLNSLNTFPLHSFCMMNREMNPPPCEEGSDFDTSNTVTDWRQYSLHGLLVD